MTTKKMQSVAVIFTYGFKPFSEISVSDDSLCAIHATPADIFQLVIEYLQHYNPSAIVGDRLRLKDCGDWGRCINTSEGMIFVWVTFDDSRGMLIPIQNSTTSPTCSLTATPADFGVSDIVTNISGAVLRNLMRGLNPVVRPGTIIEKQKFSEQILKK